MEEAMLLTHTYPPQGEKRIYTVEVGNLSEEEKKDLIKKLQKLKKS